MKRYWFYGSMPKDTIEEQELTDQQKDIIEQENNKINNDNFHTYWIGYKKENGWDFMRHGFEVLHVSEHKGNIARKKLFKLLKNKYYQEI